MITFSIDATSLASTTLTPEGPSTWEAAFQEEMSLIPVVTGRIEQVTCEEFRRVKPSSSLSRKGWDGKYKILSYFDLRNLDSSGKQPTGHINSFQAQYVNCVKFREYFCVHQSTVVSDLPKINVCKIFSEDGCNILQDQWMSLCHLQI